MERVHPRPVGGPGGQQLAGEVLEARQRAVQQPPPHGPATREVPQLRLNVHDDAGQRREGQFALLVGSLLVRLGRLQRGLSLPAGDALRRVGGRQLFVLAGQHRRKRHGTEDSH